MIQPRNTFVIVELIEQPERQVGKIVIPTNSDLYCQAEVVAVGPGNINASGARSENHDLHPGQRVLVKYQEIRQAASGFAKNKTGTEYRTDDGKKYMIFEQMSIIAILHDGGYNAKVPLHPLDRNMIVK